MKIIAIIDCSSCCTLEQHELNEGTNNVPSCSCGAYFGDEGGTVEIKIERDNGRALDREKLEELIEKPAIWAQMWQFNRRVETLNYSLSILGKGNVSIEGREKLNSIRDKRRKETAEELEKLLHQLREAGYR